MTKNNVRVFFSEYPSRVPRINRLFDHLSKRIKESGQEIVGLDSSNIIFAFESPEIAYILLKKLGSHTNQKLLLVPRENDDLETTASMLHLSENTGEFYELSLIGFSIIPPFTDSSILEIARPLQTPISELEKARSFFESLGFRVVEVPDGPGLIQARIVACLANEAMSALSEGVADAKTIDTAMKLGTNYPLGPLEWAELIGLESILAIMEGLQAEYGEDRYRPHPLLKRLVAAGMSIEQYEAWKRSE